MQSSAPESSALITSRSTPVESIKIRGTAEKFLISRPRPALNSADYLVPITTRSGTYCSIIFINWSGSSFISNSRWGQRRVHRAPTALTVSGSLSQTKIFIAVNRLHFQKLSEIRSHRAFIFLASISWSPLSHPDPLKAFTENTVTYLLQYLYQYFYTLIEDFNEE